MAKKKPVRKKAMKTSGKQSSKKSVSKPTKKATKAGVKSKQTGSATKKKVKAAKKVTAKQKKSAKLQKPSGKKGGTQKRTTITPAPPKLVGRPSSSELTATERYNIGGLFVCAIERAFDPDFKRLRAVLRHLDLPSQEKDNLLRLSQGFTIPKLFADGVGEHKVSQTLTELIRFALAEGTYEKKWRDEIRQVGMWLGFFPEQVEQIERKVLAKR